MPFLQGLIDFFLGGEGVQVHGGVANKIHGGIPPRLPMAWTKRLKRLSYKPQGQNFLEFWLLGSKYWLEKGFLSEKVS